jgi:hypothetical protein
VASRQSGGTHISRDSSICHTGIAGGKKNHCRRKNQGAGARPKITRKLIRVRAYCSQKTIYLKMKKTGAQMNALGDANFI